MFLHVSAKPFPPCFTTTQGGQKMEIDVVSSETLKLLAIINVPLAARAEQQPELVSLMTVALRQQPVQHGAERSDPCARSHERGVAERWAQDEISERPLERDMRAFFEAAEIVRHESIVHAIQAKGDVPVLGGRRCDRVRARHLLAIGSVGLHRKPLSGDKAETRDSLYFEFDMPGELRERNGAKQSGVKSLELCHHSFR